MKLKCTAIAFLLLNLTQMHASQYLMKQIQKMDIDNNGSITHDEINSNSLARFNLMDANGDGSISQEEFLLPFKIRFEEMDLNSDGVLKRKEIRKALKQNRKGLKNKQKKEPKPFIKQ